MLTKELSEQQTQELHKLFMALDTDGDGALSADQLKDGMRHVGLDVSEEELEKIVTTLGDSCPSGSERILYIDFLSAFIQRRTTVDRTQLRECFKRFDTRGTGRICFQDVQNALCNNDSGAPGITEAEWTDVVAQRNRLGEGGSVTELTFEDFVALVEPSVAQSDGAAAAA